MCKKWLVHLMINNLMREFGDDFSPLKNNYYECEELNCSSFFFNSVACNL